MTALLVLPVAPPGAGKSFLATEAARLLSPDAVISTDDYRRILAGDQRDMSVTPIVFNIVDAIAYARLARGLDVYLDATNVTLNHLEERLLAAELRRAKVVFIRWDLNMAPEEFEAVCYARNDSRPDPVPDDAMDRMFAQLRGLPDLSQHGDVMSPEAFLAFAEDRRYGLDR